MTFSLAPSITFVDDGGDLVFLDLGRDRYFALGRTGKDAFRQLLNGTRLDDKSRAALTRLVQSGILVDDPFGEAPRAHRQLALTGSALDADAASPPPLWRVVQAAASILLARQMLKRRSLATCCARLRELKERTEQFHPAMPGQLETIAASFAAAGRLINTADQCLPLSFAIARHCLQSALASQFAIGVRLRPFEAHAWVSVEGVLVSDRLDTVQPFRPILLI